MGLGFRVYKGVPTKIGFFFLGFDVTYPPIFKVLKPMVKKSDHNCSPFGRYGGYEILGGRIYEGIKG
jgi:hypothetical protein